MPCGMLDIVDIDALAVNGSGDFSTAAGAAALTACSGTPFSSAGEVGYWRSVARPAAVASGVVGPSVNTRRRKGQWEDGIGHRKRD